ncbi:MAG: tRNA (adenosine(37)-N6)-threonylcarbamoyltransferase complex dimerization subunit type 1 TsaB [Chloroflexota bacterium]
MLLAIDTATRWMGLALHDGATMLAEMGWYSQNTQTVELAAAIEGIVQRAGLTAVQLKAIAVAIGPGSYTGLRVGLAVAKGLALANQTPLIGVPTLDIVAASVGELNGPLVVVAEAGRSRVCVATYRWQSGKGWQVTTPAAIESWDSLLGRLAAEEGAADGPLTFAGEISATAAKRIRAENQRQEGRKYRLLPAAANVRRAGYLAELGWWRLRRGRLDDAATLAPIYLREPGAG